MVKRIIIDENGEILAVIPVEQQMPENVEKKFAQTEKSTICDSFHQVLYDQVFGCYLAENDMVYESQLWFIENEDNYKSYITIANIIKIPQTELNSGLRMTITNTYEK